MDKQFLQAHTGIWHKNGEGSGALGRNVSSRSLLHGSHSSSALELIWGRLCRQAAVLCINTSFQVDLHTPADPRMFLWNFSGIFTLSVFRPPVERLSWGCVSSVVRGTLNLVRADQIQPLSLDLIENFGFWSWSVSGNAQALVCASVIYYSLSSLLVDLFLFLRSYLLA